MTNRFLEPLLKMSKEASFLDLFEEIEESAELDEQLDEKLPFYKITENKGVVCEYLRSREGMYGPIIDVKLVKIVDMETKTESDPETEIVTIGLSHAALRRGIEELKLERGAKIAILNLGSKTMKYGKFKGRDYFDYRVKLL